MKKSLALLAISAILVGTSGCGCCRGLFSKSRAPLAPPVYSQCAPSCSPSCGNGMCAPAGNIGSDCGCSSGMPVTYGYDGNGPVAAPAGTTYETMPATLPSFPTGSGS